MIESTFLNVYFYYLSVISSIWTIYVSIQFNKSLLYIVNGFNKNLFNRAPIKISFQQSFKILRFQSLWSIIYICIDLSGFYFKKNRGKMTEIDDKFLRGFDEWTVILFTLPRACLYNFSFTQWCTSDAFAPCCSKCNSTLTYRFTYIESFRRPQQYDWTSKASKRDERTFTRI